MAIGTRNAELEGTFMSGVIPEDLRESIEAEYITNREPYDPNFSLTDNLLLRILHCTNPDERRFEIFSRDFLESISPEYGYGILDNTELATLRELANILNTYGGWGFNSNHHSFNIDINTISFFFNPYKFGKFEDIFQTDELKDLSLESIKLTPRHIAALILLEALSNDPNKVTEYDTTFRNFVLPSIIEEEINREYPGLGNFSQPDTEQVPLDSLQPSKKMWAELSEALRGTITNEDELKYALLYFASISTVTNIEEWIQQIARKQTSQTVTIEGSTNRPELKSITYTVQIPGLPLVIRFIKQEGYERLVILRYYHNIQSVHSPRKLGQRVIFDWTRIPVDISPLDPKYIGRLPSPLPPDWQATWKEHREKSFQEFEEYRKRRPRRIRLRDAVREKLGLDPIF